MSAAVNDIDSDLEKQPHQGRILKYHSNFYYVLSQGCLYECFLRGLLKKEGQEIWVGDEVLLDSVDPTNQTARVHSVIPRSSQLSRPKIANITQVLIVHPLKQPEFSFNQLDRYLTHVLLAGLQPTLCVSKSDLATREDQGLIEAITSLYQGQLGMPVFFTSIHRDEQWVTDLKALLKGNTSVLAGVSGAGKSSLLNTLSPDLSLRVQEVSEKIERGQHTTRHVELLSVSEDAYVADTPGFSHLKFTDVLPQTLRTAFPDFLDASSQCEFDDCLHQSGSEEAACGVLSAAEAGKITASRYQSYLEILQEALLCKQAQQSSTQKEEYGSKTLNKKGKKDLQILRLKEKQRESSRRVSRQALTTHLIADQDADLPLE
jgi:ribosome biogenesis GTPase